VTTHLSANLTSTQPSAPGASPISHTMLDLLIIFVPYLPQAQSSALFTATATGTMLEHHDATVQKKSYRLLKRLLEAGRLGQAGQGEKLDEFVVKIGEAGAGIGPGAQRVRLTSFVPRTASESISGTK
jgi:ribosomal RNA-processing protein 12